MGWKLFDIRNRYCLLLKMEWQVEWLYIIYLEHFNRKTIRVWKLEVKSVIAPVEIATFQHCSKAFPYGLYDRTNIYLKPKSECLTTYISLNLVIIHFLLRTQIESKSKTTTRRCYVIIMA